MLKKHKFGILELAMLGSLLFFSRNAKAQSIDAEYNTQNKSISGSLNADLKKVSPFIYYSNDGGKITAIDVGISSEKINLKPFAAYIENALDIDRCGGLKADFNLKKSVLNLEALVGNAETSSTSTDNSFSSEHFSDTGYDYKVDITANTETEINTANTGITGICQYSGKLNDKLSLGAFGSFAYNKTDISGEITTNISTRIYGDISGAPVDETSTDEETTLISETDYQSSWSAGVTGKISLNKFGTLFNVWYDAGKILADASAVVKLGKLSTVVKGSSYDSSFNASLLIPLGSGGIDSEKLLEKQEKIDNIKKFENYNNKVLEVKERQIEKSFNNKNYKNMIVVSADKKDGLEAGIKYYGKVRGGANFSDSAVSLSAGLGSFDFEVSLPYSDSEGKTVNFTYMLK